MLFALMAHDKPGALPVRQQNRAAHLDHIQTSGIVDQAGPLLNAAGEMAGSLIILDVPDRAAAEEWVARDPYTNAGLFETVDLVVWNRVIG